MKDLLLGKHRALSLTPRKANPKHGSYAEITNQWNSTTNLAIFLGTDELGIIGHTSLRTKWRF